MLLHARQLRRQGTAEHGREQHMSMIARIATAGAIEEEEDRSIVLFSFV
jgi:hypothetical protein